MLSFASISVPTERLLLRPFQQEDAAALFALNTDPDVLKYTHWKPFQQLHEANEWIQSVHSDQYEKHGYGRLAVTLRETGELIGWSGVKFDENFNCNTIGYRLLKNQWGKGYATEAAKASVFHALHTIGLKEISGFAFFENDPSKKVLLKSGFEPNGINTTISPHTQRFTFFKKPDHSFPAKPVLESSRIAFHEITPEDYGMMYALNCDYEVVQYTGDVSFISPEAAKDFLVLLQQRNKKYGYGRWKIIDRSNGDALGWCGLKFHDDSGDTDVGYRLFRRHWGKGYATEAAKASIEYGFNRLNLGRITATACKKNTASLRVLEKCRMKITGEGTDFACEVFEFELNRQA